MIYVVDSINGVGSIPSSVTTQYPIHTELVEEEILRRAQDRSLPDDEYDNHIFLSKLCASSNHSTQLIEALVDEHLPYVIGKRRKNQAEYMRWHLEQFFLNLGRSLLCNSWLTTPEDNRAYTKGIGYMSHHNMSHSCVKDILAHLRNEGLVEYKQGKKFESGGMTSRVFPTAFLQSEIALLALYTTEDFHGNYVQFTKPDAGYKEIASKLPSNHHDILKMNQINEFMSGQTWALKAPITLKYNKDPLTGGRLYTPYQNLPSRNYDIRKRTLLNGKAISEPDYSANHLRLNLAVYASQDAGDTPYEDIIEILGDNTSRDTVKAFITRAMGADDEAKAFSSMYSKGFTKKEIQKLESATLKRYPKLVLYNGFGSHAQSLEGAILQDVMYLGMLNDIPSIPIHDALAVKRIDAEWAKDAMLEIWMQHVNCGLAKPRVN